MGQRQRLVDELGPPEVGSIWKGMETQQNFVPKAIFSEKVQIYSIWYILDINTVEDSGNEFQIHFHNDLFESMVS